VHWKNLQNKLCSIKTTSKVVEEGVFVGSMVDGFRFAKIRSTVRKIIVASFVPR